MTKPELLLPAGNLEAFYAALKGGADAVYLGLRQFNARERAKNFSLNQYASLLEEAAKHNISVYLTLNTLIKNSELPELLNLLNTLQRYSPAALIIQDWGVYYLVKKYFPKLVLHASTQMTFHNSAGTELAEKLGFERIILARELTMSELKTISQKSKIELEIFIHGALCYSFSGLCLFSSFLGGMSANRGNCRQPCRRLYHAQNGRKYYFNLKDNQQAQNIPLLAKMGISSLKIEGRMKSAEYVYKTAKAYRLIIENPENKKEALQTLFQDMGREKTDYFMGKKVDQAISTLPFSGLLVGKIVSNNPQLKIELNHTLSTGSRIRILGSDGYNSKAFKIKKMRLHGKETDKAESGDLVELLNIDCECQPQQKVFLAGSGEYIFPNKLPQIKSAKKYRYPQKKMQQVIENLALAKSPSKQELFIRINDPSWLRKVHLPLIDWLIIDLTLAQLAELPLKKPFWQKNIEKIIIQLPPFIAEDKLTEWQKEIQILSRQGISSFMLSHLSQKLLFKSASRVKLFTAESVYVLNDAASALLRSQGITNWVYPLENDYPNLITGKDRRGIVPLYFYPPLFYSRMPVEITEQEKFSDQRQNFMKRTIAGITVVIPETPVSLLQNHQRLYDKGFRRFLLDFSWKKASTNTFYRILKLFTESSPEQPSCSFNFKASLK